MTDVVWGAPPTPVWRPEGVSTSWLTAVLRHRGVLSDGVVSDVLIEPVGTGQMADCFRMRLAYDGAAETAPASVVGKFTAASDTSRSTALAMRTSEVEVRFYQQVAHTVAVRTPRCYFADVDPTTAQFVLLLEDLAIARPGDQVEGCSDDQAALALAELVGLHAPRWSDAGLTELPWLNRRSQESIAFAAQLLPALFDGFVERYGEALGPDVIEVGRRLLPHIDKYLRHQPGPYTVQHADYRLDNLLFGPAGEDPPLVVVDWQTVCVGPALADVSYFLGAGLSVEDRRRHEDDLVRHYHSSLRARGVEGYGWDECWTDYRRYAYAGYLMAVGASMMVERTARGDDMFMAMASRHAAQVDDLASDDLLRR